MHVLHLGGSLAVGRHSDRSHDLSRRPVCQRVRVSRVSGGDRESFSLPGTGVESFPCRQLNELTKSRYIPEQSRGTRIVKYELQL